MLRKTKVRGNIHGVKICRQAPFITHLFFVYDSVLFARALVRECVSPKQILHHYELGSRQKINFEKSIITFSRNSHQGVSSHIQTALGVKMVDFHNRYNGLHTIIGKSKRHIFSSIREYDRSSKVGKKNLSLQVAKRFLSR